MRRFCLGLMTLALAVTVHAEEATQQPYLVLNTGGHTAPISKILFTPDGKEVVTVSEDRTVRRWDAVTGEPLAVLRLPVGLDMQGALFAGALSPDGKTLAVAGAGFQSEQAHGWRSTDQRVFLIDLVSNTVAATLAGNKLFIGSLTFSHDGKVLAGGDLAGVVYVWDAASGRLRHMLESHPAAPTFALMGVAADLAFSPDDTLLAGAYGASDKTVRLWTVKDGKEACPPLEHESGVKCVAWKDNDTLATGGAGFAYISLWDRTGKRLQRFDKLRDMATSITSMAFLPGKDELFYTWSEETGVLADRPVCKSGGAVLNLTKPEASRDGLTWENHQTDIRGAVSPDGALAATSGDDDIGVNLWTLKDGKVLRRLAGRGQTPFWAGWSRDNTTIGWTNVKTALKGKTDDALQRSFDLGDLRFGKKPDGKFARAAHTRGDLQLVWPVPQPNGPLEIRNKKGHVSRLATFIPPSCYTFLPGDRIALGWKDLVFLFEARTGKSLRVLKGPLGTAWDLAVSPDGRYLLVAFSDQTLRVYDPEKPEPLLSLFVAGSDWIAWTQEGYYAASPAGEKLMGWQVNNGLDQLGTFYPAAQFHKAFYRPDIIQRVLAEGSVDKARAAADKAAGAATEDLNVAEALPPEAAILSPAEGKQDKAEVEVKARALGKGRPVASLQLLLDGRPFQGAEIKRFTGARSGETQATSWKVTLPEGDHTLSVRAESDASAAASPAVAVSYRKEAAQETLPTLYVLAVGINAYPGTLKLNWAAKDAISIADAFRAGGAPRPFGKVEVKLLLDKEATKEAILAGLDWLKEKMTADDTALVFYAGHGHRDKKTSQFYMLPQDVDVADLDKTGVTGTQLKEKLRAVPGRVLVLLDACHSGSIGQSPPDAGSLTDDVQRQLTAPDCGVVVMCAAMAQEEAGESAEVAEGFFTKAVLNGLSGAAPRNADGLIHLAGLDFYVEEEVARLSKDGQHAVMDRPSTVTSFPLVKPLAK